MSRYATHFMLIRIILKCIRQYAKNRYGRKAQVWRKGCCIAVSPTSPTGGVDARVIVEDDYILVGYDHHQMGTTIRVADRKALSKVVRAVDRFWTPEAPYEEGLYDLQWRKRLAFFCMKLPAGEPVPSCFEPDDERYFEGLADEHETALATLLDHHLADMEEEGIEGDERARKPDRERTRRGDDINRAGDQDGADHLMRRGEGICPTYRPRPRGRGRFNPNMPKDASIRCKTCVRGAACLAAELNGGPDIALADLVHPNDLIEPDDDHGDPDDEADRRRRGIYPMGTT